MTQPPFIEIEHTADLALRVHGPDLPSLFCHAAQGLFDLMRYDPAPDASPAAHALELEAFDAEMLLVDWLDELLYLAHREALRFERFTITDLTATSLRAEVHGSGPRRPRRIIKAVTYADLAIRRVGDSYETIVTFDV